MNTAIITLHTLKHTIARKEDYAKYLVEGDFPTIRLQREIQSMKCDAEELEELSRLPEAEVDMLTYDETRVEEYASWFIEVNGFAPKAITPAHLDNFYAMVNAYCAVEDRY